MPDTGTSWCDDILDAGPGGFGRGSAAALSILYDFRQRCQVSKGADEKALLRMPGGMCQDAYVKACGHIRDCCACLVECAQARAGCEQALLGDDAHLCLDCRWALMGGFRV